MLSFVSLNRRTVSIINKPCHMHLELTVQVLLKCVMHAAPSAIITHFSNNLVKEVPEDELYHKWKV